MFTVARQSGFSLSAIRQWRYLLPAWRGLDRPVWLSSSDWPSRGQPESSYALTVSEVVANRFLWWSQLTVGQTLTASHSVLCGFNILSLNSWSIEQPIQNAEGSAGWSWNLFYFLFYGINYRESPCLCTFKSRSWLLTIFYHSLAKLK